MNIEQIADNVSKEMLGHVATLQPELVEFNRKFLIRCLSKMAEQDVDPVAHMKRLPKATFYRTHEAQTFFSENPDEDGIVGGGWAPLYTEAQLLAAQQRTAEACSKLASNGVGTGVENGCCPNTDWEDGQGRIAEAIRNGDWRKYL